jgi:hypothetical protein
VDGSGIADGVAIFIVILVAVNARRSHRKVEPATHSPEDDRAI